jgi:phage-related baseplate assembly protein
MDANRYLAPVLNIATLPTPDALELLDVEDIRATRIQAVVDAARDLGYIYDVSNLETDPVVIDQQINAYRELLMRSRVNNAVRAVLPAYAHNADLDNIVARANVTRLLLSGVAGGDDAVWESDENLLLRYLTAFAAPSAGSEDAYIYHAATAAPTLRDISIVGPAVHGKPGECHIVLLGANGALPSDDEVSAVSARYRQPGVTPLTDVWRIMRAEVIPYAVTVRLGIGRSPVQSVVVAAATAQLRAALDSRYVVGQDIWRSVVEGACYVSNVQHAVAVGFNDIETTPYQAAYCTGIEFEVEVVG